MSYTQKDLETFQQALDFAAEIIGEKKRRSGSLSIEHNTSIGKILMESNLEPTVVIAGLLYGTEKQVFPSKIQELFGREIADIVFGQNQLQELKAKNKHTQAETLRKILLVTVQDTRVILVKLAAKLDNLRTIGEFDPKEQQRIAREALDMYAPLAYRLGVEKIRVQLEEEAFRILQPEKFAQISNYLQETREEREKRVKDIIALVSKKLKAHLRHVHIKGRPKHIYSMYKKMTERGVSLNEQYDHLAIRIIVDSIDECYSVLGILHQEFQPIKGRLKDYITHPKPNFYRSIHTGIRFAGKDVEVQIRTQEMDEFAEEGSAAHWRYKKIKGDARFEMQTAWLRSLIDLKADAQTQEYINTIKVNLFGDRFYCYTPKGDAIELPKGASILDFAYHIHQEVGDHAIGGRINGEFCSLRKEISPGDIVEIITHKNQRPRRDWVKFIRTAKALQKVKSSLRKIEKIPVGRYHKIAVQKKNEFDSMVISDDLPSVPCTLAKCCHPLPCQEIVGIMTKKQISVHRKGCQFAGKEKNRMLQVQWKDSFNRPLSFEVIAQNRAGILADLLNTIRQAGGLVSEAKAKLIDPETSSCQFTIKPQRIEELELLVTRVSHVRGVQTTSFL